jgi:hypothetical protein
MFSEFINLLNHCVLQFESAQIEGWEGGKKQHLS